MSEQNGNARSTGYEAIADLGNFGKELIPNGTVVTLNVIGFTPELRNPTAPAIRGKFEVVGPEEYEDYGVFTTRYSLNAKFGTDQHGKQKKTTGWLMSGEEWKKIVASIHQLSVEDTEVRRFFKDDVTADPETDFATYVEQLCTKLNTLAGQTFETRLKIKPSNAGYEAEQQVGKPSYPSEAEAAQARA